MLWKLLGVCLKENMSAYIFIFVLVKLFSPALFIVAWFVEPVVIRTGATAEAGRSIRLRDYHLRACQCSARRS